MTKWKEMKQNLRLYINVFAATLDSDTAKSSILEKLVAAVIISLVILSILFFKLHLLFFMVLGYIAGKYLNSVHTRVINDRRMTQNGRV